MSSAATQAADTPGRVGDRPVIAVSMGDPQGIGPEIIVKALADGALRRAARYRVYGAAAALESVARAAGIAPFWSSVPQGSEATSGADQDVVVIDYPGAEGAMCRAGAAPGPTKAGGEWSFRWVEDAIRSALLEPSHPGHADAIVTAPISKASWHLAGHREFPGHTELLASRFGAKRSGMLFVGPSLRVMLVTIHVPLAAVRDQLTPGRVLDAIELADRACREMGIASPRIAVCGLNPHAGEGGILGEDEARTITPAIATAARQGIDAKGPFPADTLFTAAAAPPRGEGKYDCVVAMYHDQGLIPVKLLDGKQAVNVTVGLPTVRTSPAHGTAFDIAGKNVADPTSMACALELALRMARVRSKV